MKIDCKRIPFLLMALLLVLNILSAPATVWAVDETNETESAPRTTPDWDPFQPTDSYVLAFGSNSGALEYAYFSPFTPLLTYNNTEVYGYSILFGLKDIYNNQVYEIAYCTDMPVDAVNANYQRLNLTDSTYAATHANKLRAIVLNSYPYVDLETLAAKSGIAGLSMCEAITGTQLAVWKTAHGDIVQIKDFLYTANAGFSGHTDLTAPERDAYYTGTDEYKAGVKARIEALYDYLMALPEQRATSTVISTASFVEHSTKPLLTRNADGTYQVSVTATVDIPENSDVKLTAHMGDGYWYAQTALATGRHSYTLTIQNVPAAYAFDSVTLSIDGKQAVGEDVFLLDAEGIRGVSQSMIAPISGTLPVHAEAKAEPDRILELYKTSNGKPLANISFEVYYVGSVDDYRSGKLAIGTTPTQADLNTYAIFSRLVGTITTDHNGYGALNFKTENGVYLVKELPNELVIDSVAFFVSLPDYSRCDENGIPAYTITASPKNTVKEEKVEIEKDVTNLDNEHDSFNVGEDHTWIVQSSIPAAIGTAKQYEVSDTLDRCLSLQSVDRVALAKDNGTFGNAEDPAYQKDETETPVGEESLILQKDVDYTLHCSKTDDSCDTFTVALTAVGMRKIASALDSENTYELRIYFTAQINTKAAMGTEIPNQAHVSYTNNLYQSMTADSDQPEVHTGGIQLLKVDQANQAPLAGAVFTVYREAVSGELDNPNIEQIIIGATVRKLIPVAFYDNPTLSGEKVTSLTTDDTGKGYIYGLSYGDYWLIETQAPAGYNKLHTPTQFTIHATNHKNENQITVSNTAGVELPATGGMGTHLFTISGLLLTLTAAILLKKRKSTV